MLLWVYLSDAYQNFIFIAIYVSSIFSILVSTNRNRFGPWCNWHAWVGDQLLQLMDWLYYDEVLEFKWFWEAYVFSREEQSRNFGYSYPLGSQQDSSNSWNQANISILWGSNIQCKPGRADEISLFLSTTSNQNSYNEGFKNQNSFRMPRILICTGTLNISIYLRSCDGLFNFFDKEFCFVHCLKGLIGITVTNTKTSLGCRHSWSKELKWLPLKWVSHHLNPAFLFSSSTFSSSSLSLILSLFLLLGLSSFISLTPPPISIRYYKPQDLHFLYFVLIYKADK